MDRPCVAVVSCTDEDSTWAFLTSLCGEGSPLVPKEGYQGLHASEISLETKYYTADVLICLVKEKTLGNEAFADSVEATIVLFDGKTLEDVRPWISFVKEWDPETKLLVSDRLVCPEAESWCVEEGFESVELNPSQESKEEFEEYREAFGVPRILQILKAHPWSNAEMKEGQEAANSARLRKYLEEMDEVEKADPKNVSEEAVANLAEKLSEGSLASGSDSGSKPDSSKMRDELLLNAGEKKDDVLFGAVNGGEDPGDVSFEELFGQFEHMKKQAENLPEEERKDYAEKVVMAFWKAIGGDEGEVAGLSSDEDVES